MMSEGTKAEGGVLHNRRRRILANDKAIVQKYTSASTSYEHQGDDETVITDPTEPTTEDYTAFVVVGVVTVAIGVGVGVYCYFKKKKGGSTGEKYVAKG